MRTVLATTLALVMLAVAPRPAVAVIYTVGANNDAACTHHSLPAAVLAAAAAGNDEVRLARNLSYSNEVVHLTNWGPGNTLTLAGGYDTCADASPSGTTVIDGTSSPVVEVDTTGANTSTVTLRRLTLTGSSARGLLVEGNSTVTLNGVVVSGNGGGGIEIEAGTTVTVDFGSVVADNGPAVSGGGIRCDGGHLLLSGVVGNPGAPNVAAFSGGGIFADAGCDLDLLDGAVVQSNQARDGGGIYAAAGSTVTADAAGVGISINGNVAEEDGGGVHATSSGTSVQLVDTGVVANRAFRGGGVYVTDDAVLTMDQDVGDCADADLCSRLTDNTLVPAGGNDGAAAFVSFGADLNVYQTLIARNRTANLGPATGNIVGIIGGKLRVEGVTLFGNEAAELFAHYGGPTAEIAFVTASRNGRTPPDFPVPAHPLFAGNGATFTLNSSIFWPNGSFRVTTFDDIVEADCLIVSSIAGLPFDATLVSTADPQFRNAAAGNLRPGPFSPAIDFCDATLYVPTHRDRDGETRGFDLPWNPNGSPGLPGGTFDLGADEVRDFVFYDGFEAGSTNAWSGKSP